MSGICTERTLPRVRMAYHALRGSVTVRGPTHEPGGKLMLPFLVDMARLFELFVAEWLQQHLVQDHGHAHLGRCRPDRRLCSREGSPDRDAHLPEPAVLPLSR